MLLGFCLYRSERCRPGGFLGRGHHSSRLVGPFAIKGLTSSPGSNRSARPP